MKYLLPLLFCTLLSTAFANGTSNTSKINSKYLMEEANSEVINFNGIKAIPFENRYTNDYLSEPNHNKNNELNFCGLNVGTTHDNYRGEGVTVAVIDSGIDIYHEDFLIPEAKNVTITESNVLNYSILDPKSCYIHDPTGNGIYTSSVRTDVGILHALDDDIYDSTYDEYYSHGTASAACIGAAINGVGGYGIAPKVNLLIIKMDFFFTSLDVAIRYAADNGADVINMSLGAYAETFTDGYGDEQTGDSSVRTALQSAINYALGKDCVIVAAAGNEKTNHKSYPACNTGVIGVGALGRKSLTTAADFSNFNSTTDTQNGNNNVDVMAPGYVYTAQVPTNGYHSTGNKKDSNYSETQGTSFASPLTAGVIALKRAKNPEMTNTEVKENLLLTATDMGSTGWDYEYGYGRVDVTKFLTDSPLESISVSPSDVTLKVGETKQLQISYQPVNASNKTVYYLSNDENIATVDIDTGLITAVSEGTTYIECCPEENGVESAICNVTVSNTSVPTPSGSNEFQKVTSESELTDGDYLIVSEASNVAFNGYLDTLDATKNNLTVTHNDGVIEYSENLYNATFEINKIDSTNYSIKSKKDAYIGATSNTNSLSTNKTSPINNTITFESNGDSKIVSSTAVLRFNKAPDQMRFRYFKSASYTNQQSIQLYKLVSGTPKVLDSITATYNGGTIYVGDSLDLTKFNVVAHYDDLTTKTVSNFSVTGFNTENPGNITVTISYEENGVNKTTQIQLTVVASVLESITATVSKTYYVGETFNKNDIVVTATYSNRSETVASEEVTASLSDSYMFTYEDSSATKTVTISALGKETSVNLLVERKEYKVITTITNTYTAAEFKTAGVSTSSSSTTNGEVTVKGITFILNKAYIYNNYLSFGKSNDGYMYNVTPFSGNISSISYSAKSDSPAPKIFVSKDTINWVTYSEEVASQDSYSHMKISYEGMTLNKYSNYSNFTIKLKGNDTAKNIANYIMYQDTDGQCNSKFYTARGYILSLSSAEKDTFMTSSDYVIQTARTRYEAWARSLGEKAYENAKLEVNNYFGFGLLTNEAYSNTPVIIVLISLVASAIILISLRKKKHE